MIHFSLSSNTMIHKLLFSFFILFVATAQSQDLQQIRSQYPIAKDSEEITSQLDAQLDNYSGSQVELMAYKGAVKTLKAKFAKKIRDKKEYFKEGVTQIEKALKTEPENVELHYIRMTVQENAPRIVGYHDEIDNDKDFILQNFSTISDFEIKNVIKKFALSSTNFSEEEAGAL